jgi:hypothetical protein
MRNIFSHADICLNLIKQIPIGRQFHGDPYPNVVAAVRVELDDIAVRAEIAM